MYQARKVDFLPLALSASIHALVGLALFWGLAFRPGMGPARPSEHLTMITFTPSVSAPVRQDLTAPAQLPRPKEDVAHPLHYESRVIALAAARPMPSRSNPGGSGLNAGASTATKNATALDPAFLAVLLRHIERFQRYPDAARAAGQQGVVRIGFALNRQGELLDAWIETPSGFGELDAEALATLRRAQPFPNVPKAFPDTFQTVVSLEFLLRDAMKNADLGGTNH